MKNAYLMRAAAVAATLGTGCVLAQTSAPVVTDTAPLPAEERESAGAIVLQNSLVRAQRENAFERSSSRTGVGSVGRGALRAARRAQVQADLAEAQQAQTPSRYGQGAADQTPN